MPRGRKPKSIAAIPEPKLGPEQLLDKVLKPEEQAKSFKLEENRINNLVFNLSEAIFIDIAKRSGKVGEPAIDDIVRSCRYLVEKVYG